MPKIKDLLGQRFNQLKVISVAPKKYNRTAWNCACDCGNSFITTSNDLLTGKVISCGCRKKAGFNLKHGMRWSRFYNIWTGLKNRCNNKNNYAYQNYGGRGIKCEWMSFDDFKKDMYADYLKKSEILGEKFISIDRKNNDGNYSKFNCRWSTVKEQNNNRRKRSIYKKNINGKFV